MSIKQALDQLLASLPDDRLSEILDFAQYLQLQEERRQWLRLGASQLARAYGPDETEYTLADLKRSPQR